MVVSATTAIRILSCHFSNVRYMNSVPITLSATLNQLKPTTMVTKEIIDKLKIPLPPEAISQHPTKPYLSTIKVIYIVERLNEVFGLGGWKVENEVITKEGKMVVVKAKFTSGDIYVEAFGGNDNSDLGDAYKGACTDALSKIASYLYVGMDVYKGLTDAPQTLKIASREPLVSKSGNPLCEEHNLPTIVKISKSAANPGREFFSCSAKAGDCGFVSWCDMQQPSNKVDDDTQYGDDKFPPIEND